MQKVRLFRVLKTCARGRPSIFFDIPRNRALRLATAFKKTHVRTVEIELMNKAFPRPERRASSL